MAPSAVAPTDIATPPVKLSYDITTHALLANDGLLEPQDLTPLRPSTLSTPLEELRRRYESDGYVFIKHLLPRKDVLRCREKYFSYLAPTGLLEPGSDPADGFFDSTKSPDDYPGVGASTVNGDYSHIPPGGQLFLERALKAHTEDWYAEDFVKHPVLVEFVKRFSGWGEDTVGFQRTLLRNNIPGTKAIGVHYDQVRVRVSN
jgi:phytanoyl-CoA hydroxylase